MSPLGKDETGRMVCFELNLFELTLTHTLKILVKKVAKWKLSFVHKIADVEIHCIVCNFRSNSSPIHAVSLRPSF